MKHTNNCLSLTQFPTIGDRPPYGTSKAQHNPSSNDTVNEDSETKKVTEGMECGNARVKNTCLYFINKILCD